MNDTLKKNLKNMDVSSPSYGGHKISIIGGGTKSPQNLEFLTTFFLGILGPGRSGGGLGVFLGCFEGVLRVFWGVFGVF